VGGGIAERWDAKPTVDQTARNALRCIVTAHNVIGTTTVQSHHHIIIHQFHGRIL
jgi:hypothetical protein